MVFLLEGIPSTHPETRAELIYPSQPESLTHHWSSNALQTRQPPTQTTRWTLSFLLHPSFSPSNKTFCFIERKGRVWDVLHHSSKEVRMMERLAIWAPRTYPEVPLFAKKTKRAKACAMDKGELSKMIDAWFCAHGCRDLHLVLQDNCGEEATALGRHLFEGMFGMLLMFTFGSTSEILH